jgi:hypothetical protein
VDRGDRRDRREEVDRGDRREKRREEEIEEKRVCPFDRTRCSCGRSGSAALLWL